MSYVKTISTKPTGLAGSEQARPPRGATLAFFLLLVFTLFLFARPYDYVPGLRVMPLAQSAGIAAAGAYLLARATGGIPFIWTMEMKLILGMTVLFCAGIPFAFWRSMSYDILTKDWLKTLLIFFLLTQVVFTLGRVRKMLWMIIFCAFLVTVLSAMNPAAAADDTRFGGVSKGFFSGNYLGIAVGSTLPYMAALLLRGRSFLGQSYILVTFGLMMWLVVQTASRGNLLCVVASIGFVWLLLLRKSVKSRLVGIVFALGVVVTVAAAPTIFWDRIETLWGGSGSGQSGASALESSTQRRALLMRSLEYTLRRPVFGVGLGNFPIVSGTMTQRAGEWKGTHNTFTQISSEAGIPALILFLGLLSVCTRNLRRIQRACTDRPECLELDLFTRATLAGIYSFIFSGFFAHLAYDYYFYYLAGFAVALQTIAKREFGIDVDTAAAEGVPRNGKSANGKMSGQPNGTMKRQ